MRYDEPRLVWTSLITTGSFVWCRDTCDSEGPISALSKPERVETFDKGHILGRYQSGMDQIKGTARAKLGQSCFQCNRVPSPWSRTSRVVVARGRGRSQSCFQCNRVASPWSRKSRVLAARGRGFVSS